MHSSETDPRIWLDWRRRRHSHRGTEALVRDGTEWSDPGLHLRGELVEVERRNLEVAARTPGSEERLRCWTSKPRNHDRPRLNPAGLKRFSVGKHYPAMYHD